MGAPSQSRSGRAPAGLVETTMSSLLPPEILDLIIGHFHNEPVMLKAFCTVSKSWAWRVRAHLFAHVEFCPVKSPFQSWIRVFPDPSNSPAHYARSLSIDASWIPAPTRMGARAWIHSFCNVAKLKLRTFWCDDGQISLAHLYGFSPVLESLIIIFHSAPPSEVFNLICSFPSLEDLSLISLAKDEPKGEWTIPLTSPKLTGELLLRMEGGVRPDVRRLLDLPGGLHFSSISITCPDTDAQSTADLVLMCSDTLKSLRISYYSSGVFPWLHGPTYALPLHTDLDVSTAPLPLDLSKATRLEDIQLNLNPRTVQWVTGTLRTAKSEYLRQITIFIPSSFTNPAQATVHREWEDLDHALVQLWTSRSVRPRLKYVKTPECDKVERQVRALLPELASRGVIDVV